MEGKRVPWPTATQVDDRTRILTFPSLCLWPQNTWVGTFACEAHTSFLQAVQCCLLAAPGYCRGEVTERSSVHKGGRFLHNSQSPIMPLLMFPWVSGWQTNIWNWASGQNGEQKRTTIDYYIKQNKIVSLLGGRKVINSEGPVIRENNISAVHLDCNVRRKTIRGCDVRWKVSIGELEYVVPMPASWSLSISCSLSVILPTQTFFFPFLRRQCGEDTEGNLISSCFWI